MSKPVLNRTATLLMCMALPLAGCASDNLFADEEFTPYGGSKSYPIKVVNGKAVVEECGRWPENLAETSSNNLHYNHGCAVQANIAAMAAYPEDLTGTGHTLPPPLGDVATTAIDKIRVKPGAAGAGGGGGDAAGGGTPAPKP
jgi:hypothetical protein